MRSGVLNRRHKSRRSSASRRPRTGRVTPVTNYLISIVKFTLVVLLAAEINGLVCLTYGSGRASMSEIARFGAN